MHVCACLCIILVYVYAVESSWGASSFLGLVAIGFVVSVTGPPMLFHANAVGFAVAAVGFYYLMRSTTRADAVQAQGMDAINADTVSLSSAGVSQGSGDINTTPHAVTNL